MRDRPRLYPQDVELNLKTSVAHGLNGVNAYMFSGGRNDLALGAFGSYHEWQAAVTPEGRGGRTSSRSRDFGRQLRTFGALRLGHPQALRRGGRLLRPVLHDGVPQRSEHRALGMEEAASLLRWHWPAAAARQHQLLAPRPRTGQPRRTPAPSGAGRVRHGAHGGGDAGSCSATTCGPAAGCSSTPTCRSRIWAASRAPFSRTRWACACRAGASGGWAIASGPRTTSPRARSRPSSPGARR